MFQRSRTNREGREEERERGRERNLKIAHIIMVVDKYKFSKSMRGVSRLKNRKKFDIAILSWKSTRQAAGKKIQAVTTLQS